MVRVSRLLAVSFALILVLDACGAQPTGPAADRRIAPAGATRDTSIDPNPDGTCRSGYSVSNANRCVPI